MITYDIRVAGSETTASALAGTTYWILKTPAAHAKLVAELRSHFQSAADITAASSQGLPYLTGCIEEGLRVFPPAPNGAPRVSPGAEIDGFYVPKGVSDNLCFGSRIWLTLLLDGMFYSPCRHEQRPQILS
tara:strand:- start:485 stop:877 length:393 start_codon:yes stop_codon:yes gene_type:complete